VPDTLQQSVLDMVARGRSVQETGAYICRLAERLAPGVLCSIVTIDRAGLIHPLSGPSISKEYSAALDGIAIGPNVGSCGTAAFHRKSVAVEDIFADPLWAPYQKLADILRREHGVKACWSSPILQSDGRVLGAFGFYYTENRGPTPAEQAVVAQCVDLCSLALEREEARGESRRLAYVDSVTGLGNRAKFIDTLSNALDRAPGMQGLLLVDIDHLGRVNDTFGHSVGDMLICEVARRLERIVPPSLVFRVDTDEFGILVEGEDSEAELHRIARQVLREMESRSPLHGANHILAPSVTCGASLADPARPAGLQTILQHAALALHHAKQTARGSFVLYSDDLASTIARRFRTMQTATSALAEGRIEAHYQPIVRLDTRQTVGLEALCRIRTPDGDIIPASRFAEAMQDLSMGSLLTDRMLALVAHDTKGWFGIGSPLEYVSVNVSMADFRRGSLRERISDAFSASGTPLSNVVLEVTESVYMDAGDHAIAAEIEGLRAEGMLVALDDFGTGYASLTHLLDFPLDIIKIDKSFVERMARGGAGKVIVKALLEMATGLHMRVVAEGVEAADQALELERLGCRFAQGFLFGRAVDRDGMLASLEAAGRAKHRRRSTS
jgi:diguanylate cyclase (GGDEF)-like protein